MGPGVEPLLIIEQALETFLEPAKDEPISRFAQAIMTKQRKDTMLSSSAWENRRDGIGRARAVGMRGFETLCIVFISLGAIAGCSTAGRIKESFPSVETTASSPHDVRPTQGASTNQPIRSFDFANFTYPWVSDLADPKKSFTLNGGKLAATHDLKGMVDRMGMILESILYGDISGDGVEEAIVVLSIVTGGSAIPHVTYIFTLQGGKPKLLWAFSTGDRAEGGLRRVYVENDELVVERYSPVKSKGDCCPTFFTRARYAWQGKHSKQKGKEEVLPNPEGHASLVMTRYKP